MEPIQLTGVDADGVGTPRNDGTPGSALYVVPIKLNRAPSAEWAQLFPCCWDRPPRWTTRHRPGIASVRGDRIILDGTTIEEVDEVHVTTLKLAVEETNRKVAELEAERAREHERRSQFDEKHRANVDEIAGRIKFD